MRQSHLLGLLVAGALLAAATAGASMSSTSYRGIEAMPVAAKGYAASAGYKVYSSTGQAAPAGVGTSAGYQHHAGFIRRLFRDTDGDGCTDVQELGSNEGLGGRRDLLNPWDFFDTPPKDRAVSIVDITRIVQRFGTVEGGPPSSSGFTYDRAFDRTLLGPNVWNLGPPNGSITIQDITLAVNQFGHNCRE